MKVETVTRFEDGSYLVEVPKSEAPKEARQGEKLAGDKNAQWTILWYGRFHPSRPDVTGFCVTGKRPPRVGENIRSLSIDRGSGESLWLDHWELRFLNGVLASLKRLRTQAHKAAQLELVSYADVLVRQSHGHQLEKKIHDLADWGVEP